jgi:serine protease Do
MPRRKSNRLPAWLPVVVALVWASPIAKADDQPTAQEPAAAGAPANLFADAIGHAQARCVKIYGAGIGREHGYATGLVVSPSGLILTAQGIYLSGDRIRVVLPNGTVHSATFERRSEALQAALLKIPAETPNYFEVPEVCAVQKGDWVLAVSNLYKVADGAEALSVNLGIASLRTRLEAKRGTQEVPYGGDMLLIDAITSNPGAPGGALVTVDGKLAGMIGKIIESTSTNTRLNYAVPADLLRKFIDGEAIGAVAAKPAAAAVAAALGIRLFTLSGKRAPAYVDRVERGSPAEQAGLQKDDLILTIDNAVVHNVGDCQKIVAAIKPGRDVVVLVKRDSAVVRLTLHSAAENSDAKTEP